jgi:hypothetical protein
MSQASVRGLRAARACLLVLPFLAPAAMAAAPAAGEITPTALTLDYGGGPFTIPNQTDQLGDGSTLQCSPASPCDDFTLTLNLPADFTTTNPDAVVDIVVTAPEGSDYDLYIRQGSSYKTVSASSNAGESVRFPAGAGMQTLIVRSVPFLPSEAYAATIVLTPGTSNLDTDHDGVSDSNDLCPATPLDTPVDATGCPLPPDEDGDGVPDEDDLCPGTLASETVDENGCPVEVEVDTDGDGVPDSSDQCPNTPQGLAVDAVGCPIVVTGDVATCTAPGLQLLTDAANDSTTKTPGSDLRALHLQQVPQDPVGDRIEDQLLAFTITTNAGVVPSPATSWFASFQSPTNVLLGVRMTGDEEGNAVFESYTVGASGGTPPARDGRFVDGSKPAHGTSSFDAAAGRITIVVKATDLGFTAPGQLMKGFNAGVTQTTGGVATAVDDGMPNNDLSRSTKEYQLHSNTVCGGPPLKGLQPPPPASGLPPRYQIHVAPAALGNDAAEPSVGFNKHSQRTMFISYTSALRETYQEDIVPQTLPASCPALWENKSGLLTTVNSLDPILFTDEQTGRTWNSQLSGDNSLMEYTDNDGDTWTIAQVGPPNGGADHQAVASGPYPATATPPTAIWPATGPKRAVYYCSQSVGTAFCSRSDDGGQTFGPGFTFKNTDCSAGALHGHVKVAPDGTVYVPDSSQCVLPLGDTANHVGMFVSEDAGQTWAFRPVPQSTGGDGSDPSVGIATDGTVYMCYPNADSTVHMAWSSDKGRTWEGGVDIGAALGITQTRFPQAIAGDPDRAACAFLGTTGARPQSPTNDGSSLEFEGVWHGYMATTYDHGASWHLVNVTPGDPIQGWGGVGPDGTNRNLLDFNDLQIDDEGRTYFAFADGCIGGCVKNPASNSFAAKATIIRQTGGRTLYSRFDDVSASGFAVDRFNKETPIKPQAACARADISTRDVAKAVVQWNAPDTGGSAITNYKVYRGLDPAGPFVFVGDAGPSRFYVDTTVKPSIEKYYYNVEAFNVLGKAPISNTIEVVITPDATDPCELPGEIIAQDALGDAQGGDDMDIAYIAVAEPEEFAASIVVTMKIANFTGGVPPPSSFYVLLFPSLDNMYIALDSTEGPSTFAYGTYSELPQGLLAFTQVGTLDDSSFAADGTIQFVVPRELIGSPQPGDVIAGFDARSRIGAASSNSRDTAGNVDYIVNGVAVCADPGIPVADLTASVVQGRRPLDVTFTLGGAHTKAKKLVSYEILFGDEPGPNPAPTTGTFDASGTAQLSHVYPNTGVFRARLKVRDEVDTWSTNLAEETLEVLDNVPPVADAGAGITVAEGAAGTLDGSASTEPDGDELAFAWSQVSGPAAELGATDGEELDFTAPAVDGNAVMVFRLTVSDPEGLSSSDDVAVLVTDILPATTPTLGNNAVGGGLPLASLLALAGLAALRRRARR